ncbi:indolepyruvate ferredoxin oxidoreductase family protein [Siccirubricoccus sp. KC 17139]|uniref:Indolepyruvate ferredoxin oxidoreductase family protein n=1 Tax=Siccirubricoccus soli TaxID=2899147 RepID=A0ABT1D5U8_9PROT|nr:indolepyruvate ferredoxin oxidoreductase family protein [Siccirubricoccus soli]MCO6417303.1 indolepyruvate ferredoxin oxidoreductase family protein [Siccirubricoccus soli]MCP2683438.1 indolepyruvate ferredoxin oxidoreductase family protein [Siccirubricoccus soli]
MGSIQRPDATLDDRWEKSGEALLLTGIQALVRLPLIRHELDRVLGWNTGGYVSGYRGSPLGTYDMQLMRQKARLDAANIVVRPGLNEDLAATAIWGTQQIALYGNQKFDGVFGIWYGKGPGVDRSGDALRHANSAGTSPKGGVLALAGDDPSCKSSTITSGCEYSFMDVEIPVLDPSGVHEILDFGLKAIDMSRFAGLWVGMKCVAETMDGAGTVLVDPAHYAAVTPEFAFPPDGVHIRLRDHAIPQEERLRHFKLPAALAFARANGLNRIVMDSPRARFGIAARGKGYATLRQALHDAGITEELARMAGLRLWKVGLAWPLDVEGARAFARGLEEIMVVEDRRPVIEPQLRDALYALDDRPRVVGKRDEEGRRLLSDLTELDTGAVLRALAARLPEELQTEQLRDAIRRLDRIAQLQAPPVHDRTPHFCPGCPHNTSTRVPEGSHAMAGIGCHTLAIYMDRKTDLYTHMGAEGMPWLGMAPFVSEPHMFVNIGDGTFAHSGSLAIRQAVAAGANMTYKILVNSAVAMTGGQTVDGELGVPEIAQLVAAEGVEKIVVVSDDPARHQGDESMPKGIEYHHRRDLDAVQRQLREVPGVTVLIYDQQCATERRRKRKRGTQAVAEKRVAINPRVCEDCGDCSRTSNCLAVEPLETEFGRKRQIDQSACNQDLSCVEGFCPSFITLVGAEPVKKPVPKLGEAVAEPAIPEPRAGEPAFNILIAGVGGQGVTALSAILGMAAHLEGRPSRSVDMLGLAQKGGGVFAQLRIGRPGAAPETIDSPRIGMGQADLLLSADMVVAQGRTARPLLGSERTVAVLNDDLQPTAQFVLNPATRYDRDGMLASVRSACREVVTVPGVQVVEEALGDLIYLNVWLLGIAFQRGLVPLSAEAINRALELNGAQIERNKAAFALGRQAALTPPAPVRPEELPLDQLIARRVADLTEYQSDAYARDYADFVARVREAERRDAPGQERLTRAVATQLYRLMAYKDEYEVARLHSLPEWQGFLDSHFTGTQRVEFNLAPPLLAKPDPVTGQPRKMVFGPWMGKAMGWLRHGKVLRGTALDPFGRTEERRMERALIAEYRAGIERLLVPLSPATHAAICDWAEAAAGIKGYGPVKARNAAATRARMAELEQAVFSPSAPPAMAAE